MSSDPAVRRRSAQDQLTAPTLDVLVIGGGIVGAGIVRDAAMRGLRAGLVEQHDFASGTSSRSSRLLHGGLRYLEQGRIGLVREGSTEKKTLARIAPHLVQPLAFVFPAYRGHGRPRWQLRLGVKLYDWLCRGNNFAPSAGLSREETGEFAPGLKADALTGAVQYYDALTNDARLVIDTLRSAERQGAAVLNYVRFRDARSAGGKWQCELEDRLTGQRFTIETRTIANATGPWADQVPHSAVQLRLTKGIHLVLERARLPVLTAVVLTRDSRLLFVLPWGERVIVGTTDTDYRGAPEDVRVAAEDVAYVLHAANEFFPRARLTEADVVSTWAGVRPLLADPRGGPSDISRAHQIRCPEPAWWDIAGGKLTTCRLMAEQTVDQIARHLGRAELRCRTATEPLLDPAEVTAYSGILPAPCTREAVEQYARHEWAIHLDDVLLRRGGWHHYERGDALPVEKIADWMGAVAGWNAEQRAAEIGWYRMQAS